MTNRNRGRCAFAALLAAGLLVLSGATVLAHAGPGRPDGSSKPVLDPSSRPSFSHRPLPSRSPKATRPEIDCTVLASAQPPANTAGAKGAAGLRTVTWGWRMGDGWFTDLDSSKLKDCKPATLVKGVDGRVTALIATLGDTKTYASKIAGLDSGQQGTLANEIDSAIAELQALRTQIDGEPNGTPTADELKALKADQVMVRAIVLQVRVLKMDEGLIAKIPGLQTMAADLAGQIGAAPSGVDTAKAQQFLDDMNARLTDAQNLVGPLPAKLLGLTLTQLKAGKADPVLAAAVKQSWQASFDVWKAGADARMVAFLLAGHP